MKNYYMVVWLLLTGYTQAFAQQPRLKQVEKYLAVTGEVTGVRPVQEKTYCLLNSFYKGNKNLMLNLPDFEDRGTREVMPLGYRLNQASEVEFRKVTRNLAESVVRPFYNESLFSGVSYQFCDSTVYGVILYYEDHNREKYSLIRERMSKYFRQADVLQKDGHVYSDPDYAVKVFSDKVEIYSLFHFPIVESFYPGVSHKVWYGPYTYDTEHSSLMLAFYNQESKENNIQLAFKVHYMYQGDTSFKMNRIRFVLDDNAYDFALEIEKEDTVDNGAMRGEYDTRTFIYPEVAKAILRSGKVNIVLEGEGGGRISYEMPAFQRASLYTAYEYFRWTVTNPMKKYRAW